jgi:hypothetical protein
MHIYAPEKFALALRRSGIDVTRRPPAPGSGGPAAATDSAAAHEPTPAGTAACGDGGSRSGGGRGHLSAVAREWTPQ